MKRSLDDAKTKNKKSKKLDSNNENGDLKKSKNKDEKEAETENTEENVNEEKIEEGDYVKEIFCKDNDDEIDDKATTNKLKIDRFQQHLEIDLEDTQITKLNENNNEPQTIKWPHLGELSFSNKLNQQTLDPSKSLDEYSIKQRVMERISDSLRSLTDNLEEKINEEQLELLNIMLNYVDFYHSNVNLIKSDNNIKFSYALHALNHVLKTRSRIIAHNDKIKQNKSNFDVDYRDQGLTRPKVLILVPFKKYAFKIINVIIKLLMRKGEENILNKKRFIAEFSSEPEEEKQNDEENEDKVNKGEDFKELFSGNVDDYFRVGLSISKKTLKLYSEFYKSDIIIASPLGLKTIIGSEGDKERDIDFLSSIELLIIDNADVLLMQNWDHVLSIMNNLHLQPKKSHDTDFSRIRYWLLNGYSKYYRQTLIFSSIQTPQINNLFNKYCLNYDGKIKTIHQEQFGSICQISFQLPQIYHKIQCENPLDLPKTRFDFFTEKILPQFKDQMMSHTLIYIPSYFDYVKLRNYFKKNDISHTCICEYSDKKAIDRARFLFYHGKVHFILVTERFYFYKRYKIRGISQLIFYELPTYPLFYSSFCNFLPDKKRELKFGAAENTSFSCTVLYTILDSQKLSNTVGYSRAKQMINSNKLVHMFMTDEK